MKLLFVHDHLGEFGGAEANLRITANELRKRGHSLGLAYRAGTGRDETAWRRVFNELFHLPESGAATWAQSILEDWQPDLVYLHSLGQLEVIEALIRSSTPVVRMVHDHSLYCLRGYKYNYFTRKVCTRAASAFCVFPCLACVGRNPGGRLPLRWKSFSQKRREIALNRQCDHVMVYSDYSKAELVRNGFDAARIDICVPLAEPADDMPASSFSAENLILFAGQIIRGKGVDVLLEALAKVKSPFRCIILGDGNHRARCEAVCRRLGLGDRIQFAGYRLPDELRSFYLKASIFVMSSLWPEPFGMAGPEAMRYGLPVVAFDAGAISEWLKDGANGFLVPWGDTETFAARVDELLQDKALARRLGRQARAWVQRYDCSRQIDRLEQLFLALACPGHLTLNSTPQFEKILSAYD